MIRYRCDYCGKRLKAFPEQAGKKARCHGCHGCSVIPPPVEIVDVGPEKPETYRNGGERAAVPPAEIVYYREPEKPPYELVEEEEDDAGMDIVLRRRLARKRARESRNRIIVMGMIIAVFFAALLILVPAASRRLEMAGYHGVAGPLFLGIGLTGGVAFIIVRLTLGRPQA